MIWGFIQGVAPNYLKNLLPGLVIIANAAPNDINAYEARRIFMNLEYNKFALNYRLSLRNLLKDKATKDVRFMGKSYENSNRVF